jgi:hypothetical protein
MPACMPSAIESIETTVTAMAALALALTNCVTPIRPREPGTSSQNPGSSSVAVGGVSGRCVTATANSISASPPPNPLA